MDSAGIVTLVSPVVSDEAWLGLHDITFEVFLAELDPEGEIMT